MPNAELPNGSILIDNLTLQSVAFLLYAQSPVLFPDAGFAGRDAPSEVEPNRSLALDLVALSAFIQTVVLHERIFFVEEYASAWNTILRPGAPQLSDIVEPLAHDGLPDEDPDEVGLNQQVIREVGAKTAVLLQTLAPDIVSEIEQINRGYEFNFARNREGLRACNYTFSHAPTRQDANGASEVFIGGALFYELLSRTWSIPLALHPIRSALMWEHFGRDIFASTSAAKTQFSAAEERVQLAARLELNGLPQAVCIYAPALTAQVMKRTRARVPPLASSGYGIAEGDDILSRILELREHPDTIAYRQHTNALDDVIATGRIDELRRFVKDTDRLAERVARTLGDGAKVKIKIGLAGISSEKELRLPAWVTRPIRRRHTFLHQTLSEMETVRSLALWCEEVFSFNPESTLLKLRERFEKLS